MMLRVTVECLQSAHRSAQTLLTSLPTDKPPPTRVPPPAVPHHCPMAALRVMHHLLRAAVCADPHERCAEAAAAAAAAATATAAEAQAPLFRCAAVAAAVAHDRRVDPARVLTELAAGALREELAPLDLHVRVMESPRSPRQTMLCDVYGPLAFLLTSLKPPTSPFVYTQPRAVEVEAAWAVMAQGGRWAEAEALLLPVACAEHCAVRAQAAAMLVVCHAASASPGEGIGEQAQRWLNQLHALTEDGRPSHRNLRRLVDGWAARQQGGLLRFQAAAVLRAPWLGAAADATMDDAVVELQVRQSYNFRAGSTAA